MWHKRLLFITLGVSSQPEEGLLGLSVRKPQLSTFPNKALMRGGIQAGWT